MYRAKFFFWVFLFMMVIVPGGYAMQTEMRDTKSFDAIKSSSSIDVVLEKGSKEQIRVESEQVELDKIITEVSGSTLNIYLKRSTSSWGYRGRIVVYVSYKNLETILSSGSGNIKCKSEISSPDFTLGNSGSGDVWLQKLSVKDKARIRNSGSGDIYIEDANAKAVSAHLSGSGDLKISGGAAMVIELSVSGSGDISADNLKGEVVSTSTSGSGDIRTHATKSIDVRISGSGDVSYRGNAPSVNKQKSGSGDIRKI